MWKENAPLEPSFSENLLKKTIVKPNFFGAIELVSLVTGQPYADPDVDYW